MVTIKDVAKRAGVAVGSVSRFLNGEQLKPKNMESILRAIEELGYEANALARSMKTGRTMTIGVIVPFLANLFSMRVIESIERELQAYNYSVIVADCAGNSERELERIAFLRRRQIDGFVLMPSGSSADKIKDAIGNVPLVLVDRILDKPDFDSVIVDNEKLTYSYMKRLLESGVRKVGILEGPSNVSTAVQRSEGFQKSLREYNIENNFVYTCGAYTYEEGYQGMKVLQTNELDAVFASNYELSVGAVNANDKADLRILGFDTFEIPVRYQENYTGIRQPVEEIGKEAARLLLKRMENLDREIVNRVLEVE